MFGKPVLLEDGRTVIADENYVRESILIPAAKVVAGFKPIMPTFQGLVSEEQVNALVAYVKSLSQPPTGPRKLAKLRPSRRDNRRIEGAISNGNRSSTAAERENI